MIEIHSFEKLHHYLETEQFLMVYISREHCSVCHALKPQIEEITASFPALTVLFVSADTLPETASEFEVFTAPALLLFVNGKERWRGARFIRRDEIQHHLIHWTAVLEHENKA